MFKQEQIVLERSARLYLDPKVWKKKKKCFEGGDDVFWRKIINVLKYKKKNGEESGWKEDYGTTLVGDGKVKWRMIINDTQANFVFVVGRILWWTVWC